jgi:hypothetical protein
VKDCTIYKEKDLGEMKDLEEGELLWECDQVPIPKIDLVDFIFTHISECIELKEFPRIDKEFLTAMGDLINNFIQSRYFHVKENRSKLCKVSREFLEWRIKNRE